MRTAVRRGVCHRRGAPPLAAARQRSELLRSPMTQLARGGLAARPDDAQDSYARPGLKVIGGFPSSPEPEPDVAVP